MINVRLSQLAQLLHGELQGADMSIDNLATDSRNLSAGSLFVALQGERFDGHNFAAAAQERGAAALLVNRYLQSPLPQLVVKHTHQALAEIAVWLREQMPAFMLALTGSSGKTTVKEMTAAILTQCGNTLFTAGNLNNEIGVPLTLLRLTAQHQFAVIELGASHSGEIAKTVKLVQPQAALVNNLAAAHLAGFGSPQGVAQAKGEIFSALAPHGIAIINADSHDLARWQAAIGNRTIWRFSLADSQSEFYASQVQQRMNGSEFTLHTPAGSIAITLSLAGRHNITNGLAAAALAMAAGAPLSAIQRGLALVKPMPGRLFPIAISEQQYIIDDSYNANVGSMLAAIDTLAQSPGYRVLVAGDMAELGKQAGQCHRQAGVAAQLAGIDQVLTIGSLSAALSDACDRGEHMASKSLLIARLRQLLATHPAITIVIKGSRSSAMEQVVQALQEEDAC